MLPLILPGSEEDPTGRQTNHRENLSEQLCLFSTWELPGNRLRLFAMCLGFGCIHQSPALLHPPQFLF